jgi:hypothetical protein
MRDHSGSDEPPRDRAAQVLVGRPQDHEPGTRSFRPGSIRESGHPPAQEKLSVGQSAATRAQLIEEIEALPEVDPQPRAAAILKAKTRLSAGDAKQVEDAFAARMALLGKPPETLAKKTSSENVPTSRLFVTRQMRLRAILDHPKLVLARE